MGTVHAQVRASQSLDHSARGKIQETHREHVAIYEALPRDPEAARMAITRHIADSWTRRRKMIEDAALGDS